MFGRIFSHATTQQNVSDHAEHRTQVVTQHWITGALTTNVHSHSQQIGNLAPLLKSTVLFSVILILVNGQNTTF